jgi:hypothetical protein
MNGPRKDNAMVKLSLAIDDGGARREVVGTALAVTFTASERCAMMPAVQKEEKERK